MKMLLAVVTAIAHVGCSNSPSQRLSTGSEERHPIEMLSESIIPDDPKFTKQLDATSPIEDVVLSLQVLGYPSRDLLRRATDQSMSDLIEIGERHIFFRGDGDLMSVAVEKISRPDGKLMIKIIYWISDDIGWPPNDDEPLRRLEYLFERIERGWLKLARIEKKTLGPSDRKYRVDN